jgi:hypothetical protein
LKTNAGKGGFGSGGQEQFLLLRLGQRGLTASALLEVLAERFPFLGIREII